MADPIPTEQPRPAPANPAADPLGAALNARSSIPSAATNAQPLFSGSVSLWMAFKSIFAAILGELVGLALLATSLLMAFAPPIHLALLIAGLALFLASSIMLIYVIICARATRYTITHRHIEREMGLFVKKVDSLPLGNVKSVDLQQSFLERMLNIGTIEVYVGNEGGRPHWLLEGIHDPRPTYEKLRDAVMDLTLRRGIIVE